MSELSQEIVPWSSIDESIRPLIIALRRAGVKTTVSCSGILKDHEKHLWGMGIPYLCVDTHLTTNATLKQLEVIMKSVGFHRSRSVLECLKSWAKKRGESLSKSQLWEAENRSHRACFYFDFGTDFDKEGDWDKDYQLVDLPEWQKKIQYAWNKIYQSTLQLLAN